MISVFYIAAIIAILASFKVISSAVPFSALLYLVISLLASAVIFFILGAYFSAALEVIVFVGAVAILFISIISFLNFDQEAIKQERAGLTPKFWLGPLILAFVLLVALLYSIVNTDYSQLVATKVVDNVTMSDMLLGPYILVIELAVLLLLGALIVAYHFAKDVYAASESGEDIESESLDNDEVAGHDEHATMEEIK